MCISVLKSKCCGSQCARNDLKRNPVCVKSLLHEEWPGILLSFEHTAQHFDLLSRSQPVHCDNSTPLWLANLISCTLTWSTAKHFARSTPWPWTIEHESRQPCFEVFTPPRAGFHFGLDLFQWLCSTLTHWLAIGQVMWNLSFKGLSSLSSTGCWNQQSPTDWTTNQTKPVRKGLRTVNSMVASQCLAFSLSVINQLMSPQDLEGLVFSSASNQ